MPQNVHVVVLDSLLRREMVMDQGGPDTFHLIGADRCANPAAADRNAPLHLAGNNSHCERGDEIWIVVAWIEAVRTEVNDRMAGRSQLRNQLFLWPESAVIGGDAHFHTMSFREITRKLAEPQAIKNRRCGIRFEQWARTPFRSRCGSQAGLHAAEVTGDQQARPPNVGASLPLSPDLTTSTIPNGHAEVHRLQGDQHIARNRTRGGGDDIRYRVPFRCG